MPRRQGPPDAMTATYGSKSEHVRIRVTPHEYDLMSRAVRHGGYESQSQFIRAAIVLLAEQVLAGPSAVEQQLFAQHTIEQAHPALGLALPPPESAPEEETVEQPTLDQLFRLVDQRFGLDSQGAVTPGTPMEAPLDFDEGGWVG